MAYVVACLLLVLLAQPLDSYPRGADVKGQDQDLDLRELIKDLIKLKAGDNDQRSALHGKGKEEERNEMVEEDEIEGNDALEDILMELKRDNSIQQNNLELPAEGGNEEEEEEREEEEETRSGGNIDKTKFYKSKLTKQGKVWGLNDDRREEGHGIDLDRVNINPDSELEYLLLTFQVDEHGIKQRAENLHSDTERVKGEEHDIHPTPPEDTVESQRQLNGHGFTRRNFIKDINKLWPGGIVPYEIDAGSFSDEDIYVIQGAMEEVQSKTCIKFQPFDTDSSSTLGHNAYILFTNAVGCWSYVGKISNGKQDIGLDTRYCVSNPTVIHELCHALGMEHEQSRPDRDNYVTILWNNTIDGEDNGNMVKYDTDETNPYDYESLLQYRLKAFAIDSSDYTIRFHDRELEFLAGLAKELTFYDVMDITAAYHCTDKCGADTPRCQNGGFVNHHCECTCPEHLHGVDCSSVETNSGCGGIVDITSGPRTIQSPNYPQNYSKELCTWLVQGPIGKQIQMTIEDLSLPYNEKNRCYHWLEMRYNLVGQTGLRKCGDVTNEIYTTSWEGTMDGTINVLLLIFDSSYAADKPASRGFSINLESVEPGCTSSPCIHGTCQDVSTTEYKCNCDKNHHGILCDKLIASPSFFCDFETPDECYFVNSDTAGIDVFDWQRHKGHTPSLNTGPSKAHSGDYYLYAEMSYRPQGDTAVLLTTDPLPVGDWCLSFWYHMYGRTPGTLEVLGVADSSIWWSKSEDMGNQWHYASIKISDNTEEQKFALLATRGSNFLGDIAIDDLNLTFCEPPVYEKCDFEIGSECFLIQTTADEFDWIVNQTGATPSHNTGPDGAQEGQRYAYIEAGNQIKSDKAVLISATTFTAGEYCLSFYYHMYGKRIGALNVSTQETNGEENNIFLKTGEQGQAWRQGIVSLKEDNDFKVLFTAIMGPSYLSDVAVDNILFTSDSCGFETYVQNISDVTSRGQTACLSSPCLNGGTCISDPNEQEDYQCTCPSGVSGDLCEDVPVNTELTCNFEDDSVCFLQQARDDSFDWTIREGPTASSPTGPSGAYEGKHYAYVETSGLIKENDVARLTTHPINFEEGDRCLRFKYHMYGYSTGSLYVYYGESEMFVETGELGNHWNNGSVDIHMSGPTQLTISAVIATDRGFGDTAIDDVRLVPGNC